MGYKPFCDLSISIHIWCRSHFWQKWTRTVRLLLCKSKFYPCSPNLEREIPPYNLAWGVCRELCTHMKSPAASFYPTERSFSGVHNYLLGYHHSSAQGPISPSGLPPVNIAKCVPWGNQARQERNIKLNVKLCEYSLSAESMRWWRCYRKHTPRTPESSYLLYVPQKKAESLTNQPITVSKNEQYFTHNP